MHSKFNAGVGQYAEISNMVRDHSGRTARHRSHTGSRVFFVGSRKVNRTYDEAIALVSVPTDAASIERGKHYLEAVGTCQVCHDQNLAGPEVANC